MKLHVACAFGLSSVGTAIVLPIPCTSYSAEFTRLQGEGTGVQYDTCTSNPGHIMNTT
jgi:hypothetical protein